MSRRTITLPTTTLSDKVLAGLVDTIMEVMTELAGETESDDLAIALQQLRHEISWRKKPQHLLD